MGARKFTPSEASALVPRLNLEFARLALLRPEILDLTAKLGGADAAMRVLEEGAEEGSPDEARLLAISGEVHEALERIGELGAVVKDIDIGLVDFYGELEGRTVFLCWHYGEERVAHWHELDEGFSGRRPLAGSRTFVN